MSRHLKAQPPSRRVARHDDQIDAPGGDLGHFMNGRSLVRNVVWNLAGQAVPLVVTVIAIPILVRGYGIERFGILTLAWLLIGYFSLFDLGVGRALTQLVADRIGRKEERAIPSLVWTALALMLALGVVGASVLWSVAPLLVEHWLKIPTRLQAESVQAFDVLAISVPVVVLSAGLRATLEACQRFQLSNAVRIPMALLMIGGPVLVLPYSNSLVPAVLTILLSRVLACGAFFFLCLRVIPRLTAGIRWDRNVVPILLRFGGWMTVSNIVGPLMVYLDRFLIASFISVTAAAYYATPYEVVTKLLVVPAAITGVLFPAFATSFVTDRLRTLRLFDRGLKYTFLLTFPVTVMAVTLAGPFLQLWLGTDFAGHSTHVLQLLAIGVFINSLSQIAFALIQGIGRPDLTAKLHLLELPLYLVALLWLLPRFGIDGAAGAWLARVSIDTIALFVIARRTVGAKAMPRGLSTQLVGSLACMAALALLPAGRLRVILLLCALMGAIVIAWLWTPEVRSLNRTTRVSEVVG